MPAVAPRRPLPKPAPDADPRFRKVMEQLKQGAAKTKAHPPAAKKAQEASAAAKGPPREKLATGKAKQVDKIQEAPAKKPDENSFLSVLRAEIQKVMPQTLGDTENFMKGGSSGQLKGSLQSNVSQQKSEAEGGVKTASKEPPKETGEAKIETPIPPEGAPAAPAVNGAEGMPAPKPDADVSLQDSKQDTEAQMKEAEVTPQQLKKANDPRFSAVLSAKDAVAKQADTAPAAYRASEKGVLAGAATAAQSEALKGASIMRGVRAGSNSAVLSKQAIAKQKEEQERKAVTDHIEEIYNKTKEKVELKLSSLETEVGSLFDAGIDAAVNGMTDYVNARMDEYKDDRYSGILGGARWLKDKLFGLPAEANVFYEAGRKLFTRLMDALVVKVAALVETRLKEAKAEVAKGQAEIKTYVSGLAPNLKSVGTGAAKEIEGRFQQLTQSIDDKKNDLAQQLAQKYKASFDKANEALKKIQDANKGLVTAFVEKLGEIIKILREFKDKLLSLLKKAADVIGLIISDPIAFLGNLISAIKKGISQFVDNIWTHLKRGFMTWLFGSLAEAGIEIPSDFSLPSILKMVLAVLGITYERMRAKAVKLVGERAVKIIEKLVAYIKALIEGGPAKLWEMVKEDLSNLKQMVFDALQDWLISTIVKKATIKLISMFNPAGAIIQAILLIYDTVTFLIENATKILAFVEAVIDSVAAIAAGAIGSAANWIENALGRMIPLLIGFLAQLLGLGGIGKKIREFITKVQDFVDKAIDKAIVKVVSIVKKLFGGGKDAKPDERTEAEKQADLDRGMADASKLLKDPKARHAKITAGLASIKAKYKMTVLDLVVDADSKNKETVHVHAEINPTKDSSKEDVPKADPDPNRVPIIKPLVGTSISAYDPAADEKANLAGMAEWQEGSGTIQIALYVKEGLGLKLGGKDFTPENRIRGGIVLTKMVAAIQAGLDEKIAQAKIQGKVDEAASVYKIKGVEGIWHHDSDNTATFNAVYKATGNRVQAARATFTGTMAKKLFKFERVEFHSMEPAVNKPSIAERRALGFTDIHVTFWP